MKSYAPTIDSLKNKAPRELHAIFRNAADAQVRTSGAPAEKLAAARIMDTVRRCLSLKL